MNLFDRETKREKVLEGIHREKMLKLRSERGLKTAIKKMKVLGMETFKKVATRRTEEETIIEDGIAQAEKNFYQSIEDNINSRKLNNKPVVYADDYEAC